MADTMTLEQVREEMLPHVDGTDTHTKVPVVKMQGWADAIDAAIKQREQDKEDAARYRHMIETSPFMCFGASEYSKKSDLDEAIDNSIAAMAKESGNG